jgi:hypothetical protein
MASGVQATSGAQRPATPNPRTTPPAPPAPIAAWGLHGDGKATVGNVDLAFEGGFTLTPAGVAFDGVTGRAVTTGGSPLDITRSFAISAWVTHPDQLADLTYAISLSGDDELRLALGIAGTPWYFGTTDADVLGRQPPRSNEWVHLVAASDRDEKVNRLYVNGEQIAEADDAALGAAPGPMYVGGAVDGNFWAGAVADVALYQEALTADQVAQIFESTRPSAAAPQWTPDPSTYADGILNGTWDYELRDGPDKMLIRQLRADYGHDFDVAVIRMGFDGARWWQGTLFDGQLWINEEEGVPAGDGGIIEIDGDRLVTRAGHGVTTFRWSLEGSDLTIGVVSDCNAEGECLTRDELADADPLVLAFNEHTFAKSGDDGSL